MEAYEMARTKKTSLGNIMAFFPTEAKSDDDYALLRKKLDGQWLDFHWHYLASLRNKRVDQWIDFRSEPSMWLYNLSLKEKIFVFTLVDLRTLSASDKLLFNEKFQDIYHAALPVESDRIFFEREFRKSVEEQKFDDRLWTDVLFFRRETHKVETFADEMRKKHSTISWSKWITYGPITTCLQLAVLFCLVNDLPSVPRQDVLRFISKSARFLRLFAAKHYYRQCRFAQIVSPLSYEEVYRRVQTPEIQDIQYAQWDALPDTLEIMHGRTFVDFVRAQKYKNTGVFPENTLLPELWELVCSFIIGYANYVVLSVPLCRLVGNFGSGNDDGDENENVITFDWLNGHNVRHFLGPASGEPYWIQTDSFRLFGPKRVQGGCPFNTCEIIKSYLEIYRNEQNVPFDGSDRFLVGLIPQLSTIWNRQFRAKKRSWSTWRTNFSDRQSFVLLDDVRAEFSKNPQSKLNETLFYNTGYTSYSRRNGGLHLEERILTDVADSDEENQNEFNSDAWLDFEKRDNETREIEAARNEGIDNEKEAGD